MFLRFRKQTKKRSTRRVLRMEPIEPRRMLSVVTVTTDQDIVDPSDQLTSLREAIQMANDLEGADEIVFDFGHEQTATIQLEHGEFELTDGVTITGPGREMLTIDAQHRSRIFNITATEHDFAIAGLTLTGGQVVGTDRPEAGGAIRSDTAGLLTLRQSTITNSVLAGNVHGVSIAASGDVVIQSSVVSGNTSTSSGEHGNSPLNVLADGNLTISSSTITDNSGGIHADGDVTVQSSTISRNGNPDRPVDRPSDVIPWLIPRTISSLGDVTVSSSTISENSANGIRATGDVTVSFSTISGNHGGYEYLDVPPARIAGGISARDVTIISSTISGNRAGGISARNATIKSSTVAGNIQSGTGFVAPGVGVTFGDNLVLENAIVAANQGGDLVLAVRDDFFRVICSLRGDCPEEHVPVWTVRHSLIGHNRGTRLAEARLGQPDSNGNLIGGPVGGAIDPRLGPLSDNGGPMLTHPLLPDSPAIDTGDASAVAGLEGVSSFDQRGAPYSRVVNGRVDMGAFERQDLLATIERIPSPTVESVDTVTIEFTKPVTGFDVGDLKLTRNTDGDLLTGNERLSTADNQTFVLSGLTNLTEVPGYYTLTLVVSGAGIQVNDGTPLDSSASVSWAMGRAAFGLTVDTLVDEMDGRIDDGDISLRDALAFAAPGETITFEPSLDGGTLLLSMGEIWIDRAVTVDATALTAGLVIDASGNDPTADVDDGLGSGVLVIDDGNLFIDSPVTLRGLVVTGSDIDWTRGGAILTLETLSLEATSISRNAADSAISGSGDVTVVSSTISENLGSGIKTTGSVTVRSSTISKNYLGIDTDTGAFAEVTIDSSTISQHKGHGILASGPLTINSSTVSGNNDLGLNPMASISADGPLTIRSSTITDNNGGVWAWGDASITNSILAGNRGEHPDLFLEVQTGDCCELIIYNSLIGKGIQSSKPGNSPMREAPVGSPDANNNLIGGPVTGAIDPRLGPLRDNGGPTLTHALLPDSPAINMGDPSALVGANDLPSFDQRGEPYARVMDGRIDMGAFESHPVGDSNGDGVFDSLDVAMVLQAGKYEDDLANNATFDEGDWNGDGDFDRYDVVFALQAGTYLSAATRPAAAAANRS